MRYLLLIMIFIPLLAGCGMSNKEVADKMASCLHEGKGYIKVDSAAEGTYVTCVGD